MAFILHKNPVMINVQLIMTLKNPMEMNFKSTSLEPKVDNMKNKNIKNVTMASVNEILLYLINSFFFFFYFCQPTSNVISTF